MIPTVLLFDVDGTLVTTGGAGKRAIDLALAQHGASDSADFSFAGMTDRAITRQGLTRAHLEPSETLIDQVLKSYLALLHQTVTAVPDDQYRIHDGVIATLDRCTSAPGFAVGLGTGNIERGAQIKLARVGLARRFAFGGFGSDAEDRAELIGIGAERGAARLNRPVGDCRIVVIGDTPKDIAAAKAIGAESFAVATGPLTFETLAAEAPTHLHLSLAAPEAQAALMSPSD